MNDATSDKPDSKYNTFAFLYVFDLAEFFKKNQKTNEEFSLIHRVNSEYHKLFRYKEDGKENEPGSEIEDLGLFKFDKNDESNQDKDEWTRECDAYMAGWVRLSLLKRFFGSTYRLKNSNELENLLDSINCEHVKEAYKCWLKEINSVLNLKISISPYGVISVRLEGNLGDSTASLNGTEFNNVKNKIACLFNFPGNREFKTKLSNGNPSESINECSSSSNFLGCVKNTITLPLKFLCGYFRKNKSENDGQNSHNQINNFPSLVDFIALVATWKFLNELKEEKSSSLENWFKEAGKIKEFEEIWDECITGRPEFGHEMAFFYFQNDQYKNIATSPSTFIDNMYSLGMFVSASPKDDVRISPGVLEHFKQEELCITNNGTAHIVGGTSLVVAVKNEIYQLQGLDVTEQDYWNWIFRLLCRLKECYVLCNICFDDLGKLRKRYEDERNKNSDYSNVQRELAQLSDLIFILEESINSITASRVPFVQDKLHIFTERMGLSFQVENLNKRRENLEKRMHEEAASVMQVKMEKISKNTEQIAFRTLVIAGLTFFVAVLTLVATIYKC